MLTAATARVRGAEAARGEVVFVGSGLLVGLDAVGVDFTGRAFPVMLTYATARFLIVDAFARRAAATCVTSPCHGPWKTRSDTR
ncbi:hypothetical protein OHA53_04395 [Streptomyces althioticus]|nr:hypothetical protein OHA53_04395 [Streptomyces althioticus]